MLLATTSACNLRGGAIGIPADLLLAVLRAIAASYLGVGFTATFNTLAVSPVFAAQASRLCVGGAAVKRARLRTVKRTYLACARFGCAPTHKAHIVCLFLLSSFPLIIYIF